MSWLDEFNAQENQSLFNEALSKEGITGHKADVIKSIYEQESSNGDNTKTSSAQATGGMQIIPTTFKAFADKGWNIANPEHNLRAGIRYASHLYDKTGGEPYLTAAGYYGGEGAIEDAKNGKARVDKNNPDAPNTLEYAAQVSNRVPSSNWLDEFNKSEVNVKPVDNRPKDAQGRTLVNFDESKIKADKYSPLREGVKNIADVMSLGITNKLGQGLKALTTDQTMPQVISQDNQTHEQFKQQFPISNVATQVAGGILSPLNKVKAVGTLANLGLNAGAGAISGAMSSDNLDQVGTNAGMGAAVAGAIGTIIPPTLRLAGQSIVKAYRGLGGGSAETIALSKLSDIFKKSDLTVDDVKNALSTAKASGVSDTVLADIDSKLAGLAHQAYQVPTKGSNTVVNFLKSRGDELNGQVVSTLVKDSGFNPAHFDENYLNKVSQEQSALASLNYPEAYSKQLPVEPFQNFMKTKAFQKAWNYAQDIADAAQAKVAGLADTFNLPVKGTEVSQAGGGKLLPVSKQGALGEGVDSMQAAIPPNASTSSVFRTPADSLIPQGKTVGTETLHNIKQGLDQAIFNETNAMGQTSPMGTKLIEAKNAFNNIIKALNPEYKEANAKFADSHQLKVAYETGLNALSPSTSITKFTNSFKSLTDAEKEAFKVGLISDISNKADNYTGDNFAKEVLSTNKYREALSLIYPNKVDFTKFLTKMNALSKQADTSRIIKSKDLIGHDFLASDGLASDAPRAAAHFAGGNTIWGIANLARSGLSRGNNIRPDVAAELQNTLFNSNPKFQNQILDKIQAELLKQNKTGLFGGTNMVRGLSTIPLNLQTK